MKTYILRRLLLTIPTIWIVSIIIFFGLRFIPGDAVDLMVGKLNISHQGEDGIKELKLELRKQLGLDLPIHIQYTKWTAGLMRGDFGRGIWSGEPVSDLLAYSIPVSLEVGGLALFFSIIIALPVAVFSGIRADSKMDLLFRSISIILICVPSFWIGTVILIYGPLWFGWSPRLTWVSFFEKPMEHIVMVTIPAFILGMWLSGITMRMARNMMLEVLNQDYIRTAWSKGLKERIIVSRHVLKNAFIPVITMIGLHFPVMIGGAVVVEYIFTLPGLGSMMVQAIENRDYPLISGINMAMAIFVLLINLMVDISYAWFDPRIKYK